MKDSDDNLVIGKKSFRSRLLLGTGKFGSYKVMKESIQASGTEMVTVAMRRVDLNNKDDHILSYIDKEKYLILPNTSGARNRDEAYKLASIAYHSGLPKWVKVEVTPEPRYLLPDPLETLYATEMLAKDGFTALVYSPADPMLAKRLESAGAAAIMPLGSPIGSNRGIETIEMVRIIIEQTKLPIIIDAGLGSPSDAALAMEIGAAGVLVNTAIAVAKDPIGMAIAFKEGCIAGRRGFLSGLPVSIDIASASSPVDDLGFS